MRTYLAKLFTGKIYFSLRETLKLITSAFSKRFSAKAGKAEDFFRSAVTGGTLFSSLGFYYACLLYTSPSPRDLTTSRMPSSA